MEEKEMENIPTTEQENVVECVPAPVLLGEERKKRVWIIIGSCALAIVVFLLGMLTQWLWIEPQMRSLIKVKDAIDRDYYEEITDESFYGAIFDAVNENLLDDYSCYMTADEYAAVLADNAGKREGIGLMFYTGDEKMQIYRVCGNSPAEKAGIQAGERVIGFGKTRETLISSESFDEFSAFLKTLAGGEDFMIKLRAQDEERTVTLAKSEYVESYVFYRSNTTSYSFTATDEIVAQAGGAPLAALNTDTAYIRLLQFDGNASGAFDKAMQLFRNEGKKNLVLDMRGNGGGSLDVMQSISKYFCKNTTERKPVAVVADYGEKKVQFRADGNVYGEYFSADSRICVLADGNSASATECLMGVMLSYGAIGYGDICLTERGGEAKTYGKGIMQTSYLVDVFKKDAVRLTTAKIFWPNGNCIHGRGIVAADGTKSVAESYEGDLELSAAIAALFA